MAMFKSGAEPLPIRRKATSSTWSQIEPQSASIPPCNTFNKLECLALSWCLPEALCDVWHSTTDVYALYCELWTQMKSQLTVEGTVSAQNLQVSDFSSWCTHHQQLFHVGAYHSIQLEWSVQIKFVYSAACYLCPWISRYAKLLHNASVTGSLQIKIPGSGTCVLIKNSLVLIF